MQFEFSLSSRRSNCIIARSAVRFRFRFIARGTGKIPWPSLSLHVHILICYWMNGNSKLIAFTETLSQKAELILAPSSSQQ